MTPSLRERNRRAAEQSIGAAALELFELQGVQETSVSQIAERAGVSDRTVFRYFSQKEEAALIAHTQLRAELRDAVAVESFEEDPLSCIIRACRHVFAEIDRVESPLTESLMRVDRLLHEEPALRSVGAKVDAVQTAWFADRIVSSSQLDQLQATLASEACSMLFRLTLNQWAAGRRQDSAAPGMLETFEAVCKSYFEMSDALLMRCN